MIPVDSVRGRVGSVWVATGYRGVGYRPHVVDWADFQDAANSARLGRAQYIACAKVAASELAPMEAVCPGCLSMDPPEGEDRRVLEAWQWIPHLNDDHEWTREAIADWLDSLIE